MLRSDFSLAPSSVNTKSVMMSLRTICSVDRLRLVHVCVELRGFGKNFLAVAQITTIPVLLSYSMVFCSPKYGALRVVAALL